MDLPGPGRLRGALRRRGQHRVAHDRAQTLDRKRRGPTARWRGAGKVFGDKMQWIMRAGVPKAAVIRTWRRPEGNEDGEIQELSVFAINSEKTCLYAAIEIHADKANEAALARAEQAADARCPDK
jgi:hypothetical protein